MLASYGETRRSAKREGGRPDPPVVFLPPFSIS
jgi:hypothetical protein